MNFEMQNNRPQWKDSAPFKDLEKRRLRASELQRGIMEVQIAKYGDALHILMERTNDDSRLINSLNEFLGALTRKAWYGTLDQPLSETQVVALADFFNQTAKNLDNLIGNRQA